MKKALLILLLSLSLVFTMTACGSDSSDNTESDTEQTEEAEPMETVVAEGFDYLGDKLWEVGALRDQYNRVIDINDDANLKSMYDGTFISFDPDGTFLYLNIFPFTGSYTPYEGDGASEYFLLKTEKSYKWDADNDKFVESESKSSKTYIVTVVDNNTIEFVDFDAVTGKAKANEITLIFVRSDTESPYIQDNKIDITPKKNGNSSGSSGSSGNSGSDSSSGAISKNSSYEAILDEYTAKMEDAVPGLVSQYNSEASGISDIERLAEICNKKIGKLAEICSEGVGKMAELMYLKGDSYATYEKWALELQDNYNDIAQEIMDAYTNSAIQW